MNRSYDQTLTLTRRRLEVAPHLLAAGQPILYFVQETTNLGGSHGAFALHHPGRNEAYVSIPTHNTGIVMTLHAVEVVMHAIIKAQDQGTIIDFPELHLQTRGELANHDQLHQAQLIRLSLNVEVPTTHLVTTHKNFRSKDLSLEEVVRRYYQLLLERQRSQEVVSLLETFPVNTMLVHAVRNGEVAEKTDVGLVVAANHDHNRDHYPLIHPAKIKGMNWSSKGSNETI